VNNFIFPSCEDLIKEAGFSWLASWGVQEYTKNSHEGKMKTCTGRGADISFPVTINDAPGADRMNVEKMEAALRDLRNLVKLPGEDDIADEELLRRYTIEDEQAAFAALVCRFGPMVLRVCYRVLNRSHDAEDAFQSTFLILARKAKSLRRYGAIRVWLHSVAYKEALRVRQRISQQRQLEERYQPQKNTHGPEDGSLRDEVAAALYEELYHLPEKLRVPLVLCNLMGRSQVDVAQELRVNRTTLNKRLSRAFTQLRRRLLSRGILLSAIVLYLVIPCLTCF
jgi:RNA polymerase sigma factor (sigma-70 family)